MQAIAMPTGDGKFIFDFAEDDAPPEEVSAKRAALRAQSSLSDMQIAQELAREHKRDE